MMARPAAFERDERGFLVSEEAAEEAIQRLVFTFYSAVQEDRLLAPIFNRHMTRGWGLHMKRMCDFWSSVLLGTGRFRGNPVQAHLPLAGVTREHFDRWMELFTETAIELMAEPDAREVVQRAARIRVVLEHRMGLAGRRDEGCLPVTGANASEGRS